MDLQRIWLTMIKDWGDIMKKDKVTKLLAVSAITGVMLTTSGCSIKEIIDDFNPARNSVYLAYGPVEITQSIGDGYGITNK